MTSSVYPCHAHVYTLCNLFYMHTHFTLCICRIAQSCDDPGTPVNGQRIIMTRTVGSEVVFTCDSGYSLIGDSVQVCQPDLTWSGTLPLCVCKCFFTHCTILTISTFTSG